MEAGGGANVGTRVSKPPGKEKKTGRLQTPEGVPIRCPRCDSPNTKFCYYNNYSLTQPRHFCKTCRRYWTKGGALRNVPIGGGCRKSKKKKKNTTNKANYASSSSNSFFSGEEAKINGAISNTNMISSIFQLPAYSGTLASSNAINLYNGFSSSPSIDFHLVGCLPKSQPGGFNRFISNGDLLSSPSPSSLAYNGVNSSDGYCGHSTGLGGYQGSFLKGGMDSSIDSLSVVHADLHNWKLQQQRLGSRLAERSSNQNAVDCANGSGRFDQYSHYEFSAQHDQQTASTTLEDPNGLRTNDGVSGSFSGSNKIAASIVEPRDGIKWDFENAWIDLQRFGSLP